MPSGEELLPDIDDDAENLDRIGGMASAEGELGRAEGATLRALRELLDEKDPQKSWGGLRKILSPEGHYLWLCDKHAVPYAR